MVTTFTRHTNPCVITYTDLPGPRGLPWLGSLHQVRFPKLHAWFEEQAMRYGDVYRVRLGPAKLTVVSDPAMIQVILKSRPGQFRRVSKLDKVIRAEGIHGLFNAEGEDWKVHRRIVTRGLDVKHQQRFFPTMTTILARLLEKMNRAATDGEPYAIQDDLMRFTVDVTTSLAFGIDMNTLEQKGGAIQAHMEKIFPTIFRRINAPFSLHNYFPTKADKAYAEAMRVITGKVDEFIHAGRARLLQDPGLRENPANILDALLVGADEEPRITNREIRSNLLTLLMAGEDTTAHSLAWAVVLLGRDPQLYKRLQEEADAVLGDRPYASAYDDLGGLRYTEAVIQETLRLKAVAPVMLVEPLSDVDVEGYRLAKGSRIVLLTRASANRPSCFTSPDVMRPERWLDPATARCPVHRPDAMFPFGGGQRLCPGKNLALLEMKLVLSMLAKNFNLELLTPAEEIGENMAFTMSPERFMIRVRRRALL